MNCAYVDWGDGEWTGERGLAVREGHQFCHFFSAGWRR
ncbi:hypothetical protein T4A_6651 [Trichinella pseudospiralis]|uniref:Uncharacterized protein n=1 Tax=Trichinella pseudospiralis TaxID=6337 RepID=A0A0V1CIL1_TRIPS|nr:hypothetical protein T4A_6651 [Trichinella pseudospiralis]